MLIGLHNLVANHANLLTAIRIARETGYDGIEIGGDKLMRYLSQGFGIETLLPLLNETPPIGLSYVRDIERQEPKEYAALLEECETICTLAEKIGCPMVQLLTGPLDPTGSYKGLGDRPWPEMRRLTAKNLTALAAIGKAHGVRFYLEAPHLHTAEPARASSWSCWPRPPATMSDWSSTSITCGAAARGRMKSRKSRRSRSSVSISAIPWAVSASADDPRQRGRDVWTGGGRIPLKEWVDAVKATGFDGVWRCELLSPKYWELDPWQTARDLRVLLEYLLV